MVDLGGRLAVPGFIDNHTHFISGGFQLSRVQLRDAASPEEFARRIASHAAPGKWVTGWGWDEQLWNPYRLPDRSLIDPLTPASPVFVSRMDAHMALANSVALKLAGITRETPDPPGGTIVRDAGGEPTGLLKDAAMSLVKAVVTPPSIGERIVAAKAALREAARFGVTSLCDMSWADEAFDDLRAYQQLDLTARVYLHMPVAAHARAEKRVISDKLRIGALKGFSDGSLGSSTAAMFEPYADDPGNRGLMMEPMTSGSMAEWVADADARDLQIAIHAIGDRANDAVLSIFESRPGCRARRFRIEHAQHLNPELIQRFAKSGVIASMQPYHAVDDGRWADARIGRKGARHAYAFRSLLDAGAVVTFGSDWSVAPLDPLLGLQAAVARRWNPEQTISVEEALRCYTVNNAWAMFAENEVGRIAPGLLADIVVLSGDLFEDMENVRVDMTIFDGEIIYGAA